MQVRFTTCIGAPIVEEPTEEVVGGITDMLIHPDTGKVHGFFVSVSGGFGGSQTLFCPSLDILRFGARVYVRSADVLCDPYEIVRLQQLLEEHDSRPVLGQPMRTESGQRIGRCRDVQFDTEKMHIGWLFPKKLFGWGRGVPVTDVLEIRRDGIIVRDEERPVLMREEERVGVFDPLEVTEPSVSRVRQE